MTVATESRTPPTIETAEKDIELVSIEEFLKRENAWTKGFLPLLIGIFSGIGVTLVVSRVLLFLTRSWRAEMEKPLIKQ